MTFSSRHSRKLAIRVIGRPTSGSARDVPAEWLPPVWLFSSLLPCKAAVGVVFWWLTWCPTGPVGDAAASEQPAYRSDVAAALDTRVDVRWENVNFLPALNRLCDVHRLALFVDRRLDPSARLTASYRGVRLREVLADVAKKQEGGLSVLGSVAYIGPAEAAERIRTLAELVQRDVRQLPKARQRTLTRPRAVSWHRLDTPRDVLASICEEYELGVTNPDDLPYDLWDARQLPPLRCSDQLCLVLIGFDLSFAWAETGQSIRLVPITFAEAITTTYADTRRTAAVLETVLSEPGEIEIKRAGRKISVRTTVETHERIQELLSGRSPRDVRRSGSTTAADSDAITRYTLRIAEQPLGGVLEVLGDRLELQFAYDADALAAAGVSLDERLSFKVRDATLDELLQALFEPAGLTYTRVADRVEIRVQSDR